MPSDREQVAWNIRFFPPPGWGRYEITPLQFDFIWDDDTLSLQQFVAA